MDNNVNKDIVNEIDNGLVTDEKGNVKLGELWFNVEQGVVEGTYDIFKFISPSDKFLGYIQKSLDEFQKGLYYEILMQEEGLDIEKEIEDLKQMIEEEKKEEEKKKRGNK